MNDDLRGRVAVVTGGGWNIGRAIAGRLVEAGASVVVVGRNRARLDRAAEDLDEHGDRVLCYPADVTCREAMEAMARFTVEHHGRIDMVAAIAGGSGAHQPLDQVDPEAWEATVRTNLFGTFHTIRATLPAMRSRAVGTILTCAGGGAFFPELQQPFTSYAAAKAAICRLTDQLAAELLGTGIRVNCLQPGMVWSPDRLQEVREIERRTGRPHPGRPDNRSPRQAAELALWLLSDSSAPLTGRTVAVDDTWWRDPERVRSVNDSLHAACLRRVEP